MRVINKTDLNIDFLFELVKDQETSNLTVLIESRNHDFLGEFFPVTEREQGSKIRKEFVSFPAILIRVGKGNVYPYSYSNGQVITHKNESELIQYVFMREFNKYLKNQKKEEKLIRCDCGVVYGEAHGN